MHSTPAVLGAYAIESELGRGGMGVVYAARAPDGRPVAVKVALPGSDHGLLREIRTARRLQHPGIAPLLDCGSVAGVPFYVMSRLPAQTLAARRGDFSTADTAMPLIRALCRTLGYLHSEGLVHGDLKPSNVIVRDGEPILIDFGVCAATAGGASRDQLEVPLAAGSSGFVAPERAAGRHFDARADLYSLGCLIRWLLGDGGLDAALRDLTGELTATRPEARLGYAAEADRRIEGLGFGCATDWPRPPAYLYPPVYTGRRHARARIERRLGSIRNGGVKVVIAAASGMGKTRLLSEIAVRLRRRRVAVIGGRCEPGGAPLQPLRELLAVVAAKIGRGEMRLPPATRAALAPFSEKLAADVTPLPGGIPGPIARGRLLAAVGAALRELATTGPFVWMIDDLQWADDLTLEAAAAVLEDARFSDLPIGVAAATRTDGNQAPRHRLQAIAGTATVVLDGLSVADTHAMAASMLAMESPPPAIIDLLADRCGGNPFFIAEYMRAALDSGALSRDVSGRWQCTDRSIDVGIPTGIREVASRRVSHLDGETRRVAEAAAMLGRELDASWLTPMVGACGPALAELARRGVVRVDGDSVRFTHDQIRDAVSASVAGGDKRALHRAAAQALAVCAPELHGRRARHHEGAGDTVAAAAEHLAAARHHASRFSYRDATAHFEAHFRLQEDTADATRLEFAEHLQTLGDSSGAAEHFETVSGSADPQLAARALCGLGRAEQLLGRIESARRHIETALSASRSQQNLVLEGRCHLRMALLQKHVGAIEKSNRSFSAALRISRARGDAYDEAYISVCLGNTMSESGGMDDARQAFALALEIAGDRAFPNIEAMALGNLAILVYNEGDLERSEALLRQALAIGIEIGDNRRESLSRSNLGQVLLEQGRPAEACEVLAACIAVCQRNGLVGTEGTATLSMGRALVELGELSRGEATLADASRLLSNATYQVQASLCQLYRARLARITGRVAIAAKLVDDAAVALAEVTTDVTAAVTLACERGHLALARGSDPNHHLDEAQTQIARYQPTHDRGPIAEVAGLKAAIDADESERFRGELRSALSKPLRIALGA